MPSFNLISKIPKGHVRNGRAIFNAYANGYPEPGKTIKYDSSDTMDLENVPLEGGVLVKTLDLSIDPYFRRRMNPPAPGAVSNRNFTLGEPIIGGGVALVLRSDNERLKPGDKFWESWGLPHQEYSILRGSQLDDIRLLKNAHNLPWAAYTGVLGMSGLSAYAGWKEFSKAKDGETVFVSSGAGSVGSFVIQLAKSDGLKVIASAGSDDKVKFMKDLGADVAFNYKTTKTEDVLAKEGPLDIFWDNVGGETLDTALLHANVNARFIECGMISGYNNGHVSNLKNIFQVIPRQIHLQGFYIAYLEDRYRDEFFAFAEPKVASGEIKYDMDIYDGLGKVSEAVSAVLKGLIKAKAVVHVPTSNFSYYPCVLATDLPLRSRTPTKIGTMTGFKLSMQTWFFVDGKPRYNSVSGLHGKFRSLYSL